jgi:hypothetical protein
LKINISNHEMKMNLLFIGINSNFLFIIYFFLYLSTDLLQVKISPIQKYVSLQKSFYSEHNRNECMQLISSIFHFNGHICTVAQRWHVRVCFYLSRAHEIPCRGHELLCRGHEIAKSWPRDTMLWPRVTKSKNNFNYA